MTDARQAQLAYSDLQPKMLDEEGRRTKARKMIAVLHHFLGATDLAGRRVLDLGSSTGFIADEFRRDGALVLGTDIDAPGLARARARFTDEGIVFAAADGGRMPVADRSVDVAVLNHVYEHVVDPEAVLAELRRVLAPRGVAYLGLGNRLGVVEPHYKLPFLSYLPQGLADRYVRASGRADRYHEKFRTRPGLVRLVRGLAVWDYTFAVLADPARFAAADVARPWTAKVPERVWRAGGLLVPTYLWVGTPDATAEPAGPALAVPPRRVTGTP